MLNQKSLERIVETKFHDLDVKVTELTTIVEQLHHEVDSMKIPCSSSDDEESPLPTTTRFRNQTRFIVVPVLKVRPSSSALALAPARASPVSTPSDLGTLGEAFVDALLSTPSPSTGGDRS